MQGRCRTQHCLEWYYGEAACCKLQDFAVISTSFQLNYSHGRLVHLSESWSNRSLMTLKWRFQRVKMIFPATSYSSPTKELLTANTAPGAKVLSKNRSAASGLHSQYLPAYSPPNRRFRALNCSWAGPVGALPGFVAAIIGHATFTGFDLAVINLPQMLLVKLPTNKACRC